MANRQATDNGLGVDGLVRMLRDGRITRRGFLTRALGLVGGVAAADALLARVTGAQTTRKTDLVVAQSGDVSMLDPHLSTGVWETTVTFNLYDNLLSRHPDGGLHPSLATEWKLVSPTLWRFNLRPGVRFHNGDTLTAADVKFSIDRASDPGVKGSLVRTAFTTIERIETPDPSTVTVHTRQPDPLLPARLASYGGQIMPRAYVQAVGGDTFNQKPVGSGPVRLVDWVKGDRVTLDAYADYWGGRIGADRVVFRPIPEAAPRIAALLKGEVDVVTKLPPDHVERVAKHPTTKVEGALYAGLYVLGVNHKVPPLDNPRVKQALSLAIDREAIVKDLWRGQGIVPTNGAIASGDTHFDDRLPPIPYDPGLARQRLKEASYRGEEIVIESAVGILPNDRAVCEAIIAMWRDVGMSARLEIIEASVRAQKRRDRSYKGLWLADPTSTLADPDGMMWRLLSPNGIMDYWRHPRFDDLGNAARFSIDEKFRAQAYREMTQIFHEHWPWIPIIQPIDSYGLQRYVDWKPSSSQQFELRSHAFRLRRG